jgi:hypothetical protein
MSQTNKFAIKAPIRFANASTTPDCLKPKELK